MAKDRTSEGPDAPRGDAGVNRRDAFRSLAGAAATAATAAVAVGSPAQAEPVCPEPEARNPYGSPPGSGISMPPFYRPTPSIKNRNNFFPQTEELGADEMRITFMGSNPWPPRLNQAGTCIMVEIGNGSRLFFDFGSGCLRNIIGMQIPVPEINDIFLTHLHVDHFADLPYLYAFAPMMMRWKPLRLVGPSGRTPELGTRAMAEAMQKMSHWHSESFMSLPVGDGYEVEVAEFDFKDDGGPCYDKNGVTVRHWRRSHTKDGASAYRLDWNGLSFVWTGDGKPDELTAKFAKGADVFVSEMAVDNPALWALKQGIPMEIGAFTIDSAHTPGYGLGYLSKQIEPRLPWRRLRYRAAWRGGRRGSHPLERHVRLWRGPHRRQRHQRRHLDPRGGDPRLGQYDPAQPEVDGRRAVWRRPPEGNRLPAAEVHRRKPAGSGDPRSGDQARDLHSAGSNSQMGP